MNLSTRALIAGTALALAGCGGSSGSGSGIQPGPNATVEAAQAFDEIQEGGVIEFGCGWFEINTDLSFSDIDGVTIRGCGKDETVMSFAGSGGGNGILVQNAEGILIEGLTVVDTPDDGIRVENSDGVTMRDVRAIWSGLQETISETNWETAIHVDCPAVGETPVYEVNASGGKYGLYPTDSRNVLMEDSESVGAWDAGIYIGQSEDVILRNNRAAFNVAGIEIENTNRADAHDNIAECNTAGLMVFNLAGRPFYGDQVRAFDNVLRNNNTENFATSGIIQTVAPGLGFLVLSKDQVEIRNNTIEDNGTAGVLVISHALVEFGNPGSATADLQLNLHPDAVNIRDNAFTNNGNDPDDTQQLSQMITNSNNGDGAHIIWDGFLDDEDDACAAPTEVTDGFDDRGKPQYRDDPAPSCRYNAYKFDGAGDRIKPDFWVCAEDNTFTGGAQAAPVFFNLLNSIDGMGAPTGTPDNDPAPHNCTVEFSGETLDLLPAADPAIFQPGS